MDQEHILIGKVIFWTACLHIFLILSWWGTNFNISGLFITVPILIFKDVHNINHLVYTKQKKSKKKLSWLDWNLRQYFFIYTHNLQEQNFINKLIDSDLLIL